MQLENNQVCSHKLAQIAQRTAQKPQSAFHLSVDSRNTPATSSQNAFHHSVTTCQLQSLSRCHDALIFTNCAAARDAKQPCQKYNSGEKHKQTCSTPTYRLYLQARVWMHATTIHAKAPMQVSLLFPCWWPQVLPIIDLLSVLYLCSAFGKSSAPDTCYQETSHKSLSAQMTD